MVQRDQGTIPKVIHYVWFGGRPLPQAIRAAIDQWRRLMPDHRIIQWDEHNINVNGHPWMARMHAEGRYAFASDVARLQVLQKHGGIYLDTDVHLKKDLSPFLGERCLWSFEYDCFLATCIIATVPGHPLVAALLAEYDTMTEPLVNNSLVTKHFLRNYPEFRLNNRDQRIGADIRVVPKEYFIVPSFDKRKNFAVHAADNQWKDAADRRGKGLFLRRLLGDVLFYKLLNLKMKWRSPYLALERALRTGR